MSHMVDMSLLFSEFELRICQVPSNLFHRRLGVFFLSVELQFPKGPCQLHTYAAVKLTRV